MIDQTYVRFVNISSILEDLEAVGMKAEWAEYFERFILLDPINDSLWFWVKVKASVALTPFKTNISYITEQDVTSLIIIIVTKIKALLIFYCCFFQNFLVTREQRFMCTLPEWIEGFPTEFGASQNISIEYNRPGMLRMCF